MRAESKFLVCKYPPMLAFKCPACRTTVQLPDSARGGRVVCGHCGESVFVADSTAPSREQPPSPAPTELKPLVIAPSTIRRRQRRSSAWKILPHFIIAGVTFFVAYKMYDATVNRKLPEPRETPVAVIKPPAVRPKRTTAPKPKPVEQPADPVVVEPPKPKPVAAPPIPAFVGLPEAITLPPSRDDQLFIVATVGRECSIDLASNTDDLALFDNKVLWKGAVVAGLRYDGGEVQFRWAKDAPEEADAAIRNAVLSLKAGDESHRMALRKPIIGEPLTLDLKSATHRAVAKCDSMPPAADVRLELTLAGQVPIKEIRGPEPTALKLQDETILCYDFVGDAATKVDVRKSGESVAAVLATQYVLPSGDVEALSISRGTRKLKQLERMQQEAADAIAALPDLRRYRQDLEAGLRRAQSMSTGSRMAGGGYIENPIAVGQKAAAIRSVQSEILATEQNIARATRLSEDKPSIDLELQAMRKVEELAKSIHEAPIPYRFYTVVDGHEVDLVKWAPLGDPLDRKPALHANPLPPAQARE